MKDLMAMMDIKTHIHSDIIRTLQLRTFPQRKGITKHDMNNARTVWKMLQQQIFQSGAIIKNSEYDHTMVKGLPTGVDDPNDDIIDKAVESLKEICLKYLHDETCQTKLLVLYEKLGTKDCSLTHNLSFDVNGKLARFVYMTSLICSNLIRFGSFFCPGATKRRTNVHI